MNLVVNFDLPRVQGGSTAPDHVEYIHRIGRCSRYGKPGTAITLLDSPKEVLEMESVEKELAKHFGYTDLGVPLAAVRSLSPEVTEYTLGTPVMVNFAFEGVWFPAKVLMVRDSGQAGGGGGAGTLDVQYDWSEELHARKRKMHQHRFTLAFDASPEGLVALSNAMQAHENAKGKKTQFIALEENAHAAAAAAAAAAAVAATTENVETDVDKIDINVIESADSVSSMAVALAIAAEGCDVGIGGIVDEDRAAMRASWQGLGMISAPGSVEAMASRGPDRSISRRQEAVDAQPQGQAQEKRQGQGQGQAQTEAQDPSHTLLGSLSISPVQFQYQYSQHLTASPSPTLAPPSTPASPLGPLRRDLSPLAPLKGEFLGPLPCGPSASAPSPSSGDGGDPLDPIALSGDDWNIRYEF